MAGRPRKPTQLKAVEGNRGKRAINHQEPDPDYLVDLNAPSHLSKGAVVIWDEVAPKLRDARLLTEIDVSVLCMACESLSSYRMAVEQCADNPLVDSANTGGKVLSQWKIVEAMSFKQAMSALQQLGMSPAARTRVSINPQQELFPRENGAGYLS